MKKLFTLCTIFFLFIFSNSSIAQSTKQTQEKDRVISDEIRLKNKIIPLNNPVYRILDYYEASGVISFLPQAKPYTKIVTLNLLEQIISGNQLSDKEKKVISRYINDLKRPSNGFQIHREATENTFAIIGLAGETSVRKGIGNNTGNASNLLGKPYLSADLGSHITLHGSIGAGFDNLRPDFFYQSYTKDKQVNFPYQSVGYSFLPYQFNYETIHSHVQISGLNLDNSNIVKGLAAGMIYSSELTGNWYNGALQLSINNQSRSWGNEYQNLVLSSTARHFPGIELKIEPTHWLRYSFLTGSLFSIANTAPGYGKNIYGYDLGDSQNILTLHQFEFRATKWFQVTASTGSIWSKRFEIYYMMPIFSHFSQFETGNYDNLSMCLDLAFKIPKIGKTWLSFFNDEFDFSKTASLFRMPRNRYAWQFGLKSNLLSNILPGTTSTLKYTRTTPFVYTHYTDARFNTFSSRPLDMTYTHDGFNLGFYLPPNSGELNWSLVNIGIPDLILSLDNKLIIHGTNDLASSNVFQIYGDVFRYQLDDHLYEYPLLNFTKDGIYDWTVLSDFKFNWKIRNKFSLNYFRVVGSLGFSRTWWESNNSGVTAPASQTFFSGSMGLIVDI